MTTMAWLEFKERFFEIFMCPPSIRHNYRWQILHIARRDRSVEEYTRKFFRLSRHTVDACKMRGEQ